MMSNVNWERREEKDRWHFPKNYEEQKQKNFTKCFSSILSFLFPYFKYFLGDGETKTRGKNHRANQKSQTTHNILQQEPMLQLQEVTGHCCQLVALDCKICTSDHKISILCITLLFCPCNVFIIGNQFGTYKCSSYMHGVQEVQLIIDSMNKFHKYQKEVIDMFHQHPMSIFGQEHN